MAEYIDKEKVLKDLKESAEHHADNSREESLLYRDRTIVREQPTADVVERSKIDDAIKEIENLQIYFCFVEREEVLNILKNFGKLKPKAAHWVEGQTDDNKTHNIICSHCLCGCQSKGHANSLYTRDKYQWCPTCGYRMNEAES